MVVVAAAGVQHTADAKSARHDGTPPAAGEEPDGQFFVTAQRGANNARTLQLPDAGASKTNTSRAAMSSEKSVVVFPPTPRNICPICGKASYSAGGIHPQCAMQKADEPRLARLKAEKAAEAK